MKKVILALLVLTSFQSYAKDVVLHGSAIFGEQCSLVLRNHRGAIFASPLVRTQNGHGASNLWFQLEKDRSNPYLFVGEDQHGSQVFIEIPKTNGSQLTDAFRYVFIWQHGNHKHQVECRLRQ
jgi:hypothetical protein